MYDERGTGRAPQGKHTFTVIGAYLADSEAALVAYDDAIKALAFTHNKLYRRRVIDTSMNTRLEWCYARLESIDGERNEAQPFQQLYSLTFTRKSIWYGTYYGGGVATGRWD